LKQITLFCLIISSYSLHGQIGGTEIFQFLDLSNSASITALGENTYARYGDDATVAYLNPSVLNPSMDGSISFNHNFRFQGISNGYFSYAHDLPKIGYTAHIGIQYVNYGDFRFIDDTGLDLGSFDAAEQALVLGFGKQWNSKWGYGINAKYVASRFESFKANGVFFDIGTIYRDSSRRLVASLLLSNLGTQLSTYTEGNRETTPFEIAFGISKRMKNVPITWFVNFSNLQQWRLENNNPFDDPVLFLGEEPKVKSQLATGFENLMRHVSIGTELNLSKNDAFQLRFGYNHLRRKDLTVQSLRSLAGISFGFGIKIKRIQIDYGNMIYHLAGSVNHFSISTNLRQFKKVL